MKHKFKDKSFQSSSVALIEMANEIIEEYQAQGFSLTLRQLYYQFVARGLSENTNQAYKRMGNTISEARLAGLIDWDAIEDRTRNLEYLAHWKNASDAISTLTHQFQVDKWDNQSFRPEVWIEKEALIGVIEGVCDEWDVPYFACRGYNSQSEQYKAGRRFARYRREGQAPVVIHLGDHDPSGIDMTRDNADRLSMFARNEVTIIRVALNRDQIDQYNPPPNPAKVTDSRAPSYIREHGTNSWELDALEPSVIADLITHQIDLMRDPDKWQIKLDYEKEVIDEIEGIVLELQSQGR